MSHCHGCNHHCETPCCPICGSKGLGVPSETVQALINDDLKDSIHIESQYQLCVNRGCDGAYYNADEHFKTEDLKVPIWFKHNKDRYIVCYCRNITLDDIVSVVLNHPSLHHTKDVIKHLEKGHIKTDCKHNNPSGMCCEKLFDNAILYAMKQKETGV